MEMITYDQRKRRFNIVKHGFDFADLSIGFFVDAMVEPARDERFMAINMFQGALIVAVVFRPLGSEALSVISMRPASKNERNRYEKFRQR